ncbi:MAG: DUF2723 domain-containing protein [Candidatus Levybacteria bacterium]|nr:DUF2723 domain-containing protein [Candidatus Levybacteria bacterium]
MLSFIKIYKKLISIIVPLSLFLSTIIIYIHNLTPGVYGGDVGDLVGAVVVKGVPHPSGYPLFTIIGILLNSLPIDQTPVWKVGLISVFFSSLSVVMMYFISLELSKNKLFSFITALTLAFLYPFWLYAEVAEVIALNSFFILILLYLSIIYFKKKNTKILYLISFFTGLSLTNNHVIVLTFPTIVILILAAWWKDIIKKIKNKSESFDCFKILGLIKIINKKTLFYCLLLFFAALLPYLYVPIAASRNPPLNWDNAVNLKNFIALFFRLEYGGFSPNSTPDLFSRFNAIKVYLNYWNIELPVIVIVLIISGMAYMVKKKNHVLFSSLLLAFILTGPFFISYAGVENLSEFKLGVLEKFYMNSMFFLLIFFPLGIIFICNYLLKFIGFFYPSFLKKKYLANIFGLIFLILPFSLLFNNIYKTNLSSMWLGEYFGEDILSALPKNSNIFLQGDTAIFNTFYVQQAKKFREDINISNIHNTKNAKYYESYKKIGDEILSKNKKIPKEIVDLYALDKASKGRPIFTIDNVMNFKESRNKKTVLIPYGLLFKLLSPKDQYSKQEFLSMQKKIWGSFKFPKDKDDSDAFNRSLIISEIPGYYARAAITTGNYIRINYGDLEAAKEYYLKAIEYAPDEGISYSGLGVYYASKKECKNAETQFKKAISLNPINETLYMLLYTVYSDCSHDKGAQRRVLEDYLIRFKKPMDLNELEN